MTEILKYFGSDDPNVFWAAISGSVTLLAALCGLFVWLLNKKSTKENIFEDFIKDNKNSNVEIINPESNTRHSHYVPVQVKLKNKIKGKFWIVKEPHPDCFHPDGPILIKNNIGIGSAYIGSSEYGSNTDEKFKIHIVAVNKNIEKKYFIYLKEAKKRNNFSGLPNLCGGSIIDTVEVFRNDFKKDS